ncbi:sensor histidine kinase [Nocardia harenae]|uniref:sensor histidine kinase n=1 Tax=Nocardia harenae TaxID=358707 RepID=UPI00082CDF62|nr:histidine kinase [Nocardia harenae]
MRHLLRSVWTEPAPPDPPRPRRRDAVLLAVLYALLTLEAALTPDLPHRGFWFGVSALILPALLVRRTRPLAAVAVAIGLSTAATVALGGEQSGLNTVAVLLLLPYALFRWGSGRDIVLGSAIVVGGALIGTLGSGLPAADTAGGFTVLFGAVVLGLALRYRARAAARELDRIKLLEREQLARELHDTVAHHVSAIAIRAQAGLATAATSSDAATDALRVIEGEAARTLTEMRAIVRALRAGRAAELEPDPGIGDLTRLARAAGGGPAVEVRVEGAVGLLPPAVGAAVYRLAQESVTNAVRHARNATRVRVLVHADDTEVRLSVRDDGAQRPPGPPGFGRLGMRERAALLGGSCASGPAPDGGWEVTAVLPRAVPS